MWRISEHFVWCSVFKKGITENTLIYRVFGGRHSDNTVLNSIVVAVEEWWGSGGGVVENTAWGERSGRSGVLEPDRTRKSMAMGGGEQPRQDKHGFDLPCTRFYAF